MRQGTKQPAPPPAMAPVLGPSGLALGLGAVGVMDIQPLCDTGQQQRHPSSSSSSPSFCLLPATIHFWAGKSFTIPSHCTPSGEPATTAWSL